MCVLKNFVQGKAISGIKEISKDFVPEVRKDDKNARLDELKNIIAEIKDEKKEDNKDDAETGKIEPGEHIKF